MAFESGIRLKKGYGQHFLHDHQVVQKILDAVTLTVDTSLFEIGPGGGFLTQAIVHCPFKQLWLFEIDPEWALHLKTIIRDKRVSVFNEDILQLDFSRFAPDAPWTLLANLPYNITFPILRLLKEHRHLLKEGVIMVQEEVADRLTKTSGRDVGAVTLFFQRYFKWKALDKIPPTAFNPPPRVFSRLLHFVPLVQVQMIDDEDEFWEFVRACFAYPRRTIVNNLRQSSLFRSLKIPEALGAKRAQQLSLDDFIAWWHAR